MYKKLSKIWTSLNQNITVNKRELLLGVTASTLAGILLGIFLSPRKTTTIGSNNGSNNGNNNSDCKGTLKGIASPEEADEAAE